MIAPSQIRRLLYAHNHRILARNATFVHRFPTKRRWVRRPRGSFAAPFMALCNSLIECFHSEFYQCHTQNRRTTLQLVCPKIAGKKERKKNTERGRKSFEKEISGLSRSARRIFTNDGHKIQDEKDQSIPKMAPLSDALRDAHRAINTKTHKG